MTTRHTDPVQPDEEARRAPRDGQADQSIDESMAEADRANGEGDPNAIQRETVPGAAGNPIDWQPD
jgi:hypothetical protein